MNQKKELPGNALVLTPAEVEPGELRWENLRAASTASTALRLGAGCCIVLLCLLLWVVVFYLPYAYFVCSFSYARDEEPGFISSMLFSLLVVAGNQVMYQVCASVSDWVGFVHDSNREAAYVVLYTLACFLNVLLDLTLTAFISYKMMVAMGAHTYQGLLIEELTSIQDILTSYPMQRALGTQLWTYCFPSCFLLPFLMEPIFTVFLPYHISSLLVLTRNEIKGSMAETSMAFFAQMDMGRYGDLMLNMMLAVMVLFFPGGYTLGTFGMLALSHPFVYFLDQYRVLRCVNSFVYSTRVIDRCANYMMSIPCATLASCIVFKANCHLPGVCLQGATTFVAMSGAFGLHLIVHVGILYAFEQATTSQQKVTGDLMMGKPQLSRHPSEAAKEQSAQSYPMVAATLPITWFSTNPVHCLRSQHLYAHSPPHQYFIPGRELSMQPNHEIGSFFKVDTDGEMEDYDSGLFPWLPHWCCF